MIYCLVGGTTEEGSRGYEEGEEEECYLRLLNEMWQYRTVQYDKDNLIIRCFTQI